MGQLSMKFMLPFNFSPSVKRSALFIGLAVVALCGCSDNKQPGQGGATGKITIKGSNTVGEELAPRVIAEYKKDHPNLAVEMETKGSGSGFWGLIAGVCDI